MAREMDPATPPWLTVRMWLTLLGLIMSIIALVMAS
jgi:hypothetical protein